MKNSEEHAFEIWRRLDGAGFESYWVGGCVRDRLLGREPQDYDISTAARPEDLLRIFPNSELAGRAFGVVLVKINGQAFEVATFRKDGPYSDGRRPDWVEYSDAASDVKRRDFTINGMLYNPGRDELIDMVGGRADLEAGIIRCIGNPDERFGEDYLRLMRCVRFAARLSFRIEDNTCRTLKHRAACISRVAVERICDELIRIIVGPNRGSGLRLLHNSGLLKEILPEVANLDGIEQSPEHHPEGDAFEHTCRVLDEILNPDDVLAFAALLHDIGKKDTQISAADRIHFHGHAEKSAEMARDVCRRLRISGAKSETICSLVANHMRFKDFPQMGRAAKLRLFSLPEFEKLLELHRADRMASSRRLDNYEAALSEYNSLSRAEREPEPLINGHELLAAGFTAGPLIGDILNEVRNRQLEGELLTREDALIFVEGKFRK